MRLPWLREGGGGGGGGGWDAVWLPGLALVTCGGSVAGEMSVGLFDHLCCLTFTGGGQGVGEWGSYSPG